MKAVRLMSIGAADCNRGVSVSATARRIGVLTIPILMMQLIEANFIKMTMTPTETDMNCPRDGHTLEFISGDFGTGVFAPDGGQEIRYQEGWQCPKCETVFDESDVSELEEL